MRNQLPSMRLWRLPGQGRKGIFDCRWHPKDPQRSGNRYNPTGMRSLRKISLQKAAWVREPLGARESCEVLSRVTAFSYKFASIWVALAALTMPPMMTSAQDASSCQGPADLTQAIASHPTAEAYDALGAYFGQRRQFSCALPAFERALQLSPNSWEAHYDLAISLLTSGNPQRALDQLRSASSLNPGSLKIHLATGLALSQLNQKAAAIDEFKAVLQSDPRSVQALDGIAQALIGEGRYSAAIASLKDAPKDEVLQLDLAIAYSQNENTGQALQILSALIQEHPSYARAHANLAIAYTRLKRFEDAAREFSEALRLDPSDDVSPVLYVRALIVLGRFDAAAPVIRSYLRRKPNDFEALYLSGVVDRGLGKYAEAGPLLQRAVALNPKDADARTNLGSVLAKLGKPAQARVQLETALQINPHASEARLQLASVLRSLGKGDQARQDLTALQKEKEESVQQDVTGAKDNEANEYLKEGNVQGAIDRYRASIAENPNNPGAYYGLALALDRLGDDAGEQSALEKAVALDPKFAPAHNQLGLIQLKEGRSGEAEAEFKTAISLNRQYAEAQNNLGVLYGQRGDITAAEPLFREATENDSKYGQAFVNLGLIQAKESHLREAEQTLRTAVALEPNNTRALTARAMVLVHLNRGDEALPYFRKVAELDPKSPGAHLNLGVALADQLDLKGALSEFSAAVRLDRTVCPPITTKAEPCSICNAVMRQSLSWRWLLASIRGRPSHSTCSECWQSVPATRLSQSNNFRGQSRSIRKRWRRSEMLGQQLLNQGDNAGAITQWRKVVELQPTNGKALYNLARLLSKSDPDEAKGLEDRLEALQAEQHVMDRAQLLGILAWRRPMRMTGRRLSHSSRTRCRSAGTVASCRNCIRI